MRQALSSTQKGYDLLAPKFEHTPFRTPDQILTAAVAHLGKSGPIESALDLCCGTGAAMRALRPFCRRRVVGLDFSQGMLQVGREATAQAPGTARLDFVQADVLQIPFREEFDLAVCFGALGHISRHDQDRFVGQVASVLRQGGRFVTATSELPSLGSPGYWIARAFNAAMHMRNFLIRPPFIMFYLRFMLPEMKRLLESAGFDVQVHDGLFEGKFSRLKLIVATRR